MKNHYSAKEIQTILKQYEKGKSIESICVEYSISRQTFYAWRRKHFNQLSGSNEELNRLKRENQRLKQLFAEILLKYEDAVRERGDSSKSLLSQHADV